MSFYTAMNANPSASAEYYPAYAQNEYKYQYEMSYQPQAANGCAFQSDVFHHQQQQQQYAAPYYFQEQQQQQQQNQQQQSQQYQYYSQYPEQPEQLQVQPQYHYYNYSQQQQQQQQQPAESFFNMHQSTYIQQQQVVFPNATLEQQNFFKQEAINTKEEFENSCHDSEKEENQSITYSPNSPNPHRDSSNSVSQSPSSINLKTEEILPLSPQQIPSNSNSKKTAAGSKKIANKKSAESSSSSFEKTKQSISKNNIRNFLTPIVRMRSGYVDYQFLEKEKLTTLQYDAFLKEHFYMPGQTRLNIRQTIFDSLLDPQDKTQLKEKKVFAMIVIKKIQEQFLRLILEKRTSFSDQEFKQQFEWINGINETLVEFLNSFSN